jgi:hypothetical protein
VCTAVCVVSTIDRIITRVGTAFDFGERAATTLSFSLFLFVFSSVVVLYYYNYYYDYYDIYPAQPKIHCVLSSPHN